MLGRPVGSSLLRLPIYTRLPLRPSPFQCQQSLASRAVLISSQRCYATPARPKKAVGEPSKPIKRAAKRTAKASKGTGEARKRVEAKKKAAAKKPKRPAKKQLTDKQKEVAKVKLEKAKIADLKKAALSPPKPTKRSAYNEFVKEKAKGTKGNVTSVVSSCAQEWKQVTPAEREHYNHLAHQSSETAQAEYKRWVESHTPEQIHMANRARHALKRKLNLKKGSTKWNQIQDERAVKRPLTPYIQFSVDRHASGDFRNIGIGERAKLIGQEWKALSESEKKRYNDLHKEDVSRYTTEHNSVYGHMPPGSNNVQPQAAAAAG